MTSPQRRLGRPRQQSISREPRVSAPIALDFEAFLESRNVGDMGDDFLDLCDPRAPQTPSTNSKAHDAMLHSASGVTNEMAQQVDGHTVSPFDTEYMLLDSPIFHADENIYTMNDSDAIPIPGHLKEECLEKLSVLNSSLFRQLSSISSGKLADWLATSPSPRASLTQDRGDFSSPIPHAGPRSPIGDMLQSSQDFLNILKCFAPAQSSPPSCSPSHSSVGSSYSDFDPDDLFSDAIKPESYSPSSSIDDQTSSIHDSFLSSNAPPAGRQPGNSAGCLRSDIPSTLAILTCYVCLVRIYGTVLTQIHQMLLIRPLSLAELPAILPGLQLGGFQLDGQQHLQIGVLVEISMHMLDQIETVLGLPNEGGVSGSGNGLLEDSVSLTLLNIVINQDAAGCAGGDEAGIKSLRITVKSIKGLLKGKLMS